jgi:hypothetical protein
MSDYIPDAWTLVTGTWNTDADLDESISATGDACLRLRNTLVATEVAWRDAVSVEGGKPYRAEFTLRSSSTTAGHTVTARIRWYTASGAWISDSDAVSAVLSAAYAFIPYTVIANAPATARMAKLSISKAAQAFYLYIDFADLYAMPVAFHAYLNANSSTLSSGQAIPFNTEAYDYGNTFTNSGYYDWICPASGVYSLQSCAMANDLDADEWFQASLVYSASGPWSVTGLLSPGSLAYSRSADLNRATSIANYVGYITAGTRIRVAVEHNHTGGLTLRGTGAAALTSFSGARVE